VQVGEEGSSHHGGSGLGAGCMSRFLFYFFIKWMHMHDMK